ncbi:MAG: AAA family ATPase [Bacteroidetes bacterium]|nr:AAA family ATPase [Bacteroidota bacterium]
MNVEELFLENFPYEPTNGQRELIGRLSRFFITQKTPGERRLFIIRGYAGTGKTTVVSSLVQSLPKINKQTVLLAPTGRAAKVLTAYTRQQAFTIHKKIYLPTTNKDGSLVLRVALNKHKNTVFIVDEASMIPKSQNALSSPSLFGYRDVLDDLIEYVYSGLNNSILFIGDIAQLPPVGMSISPALDPAALKSSYHLDISGYELKDVVRQSLTSGILANATALRSKLSAKDITMPFFNTEGYPDIQRINGSELTELLETAYSKFGPEEVAVITRSNKRANLFNQQIRHRILYKEEEIEAGDLMMVVKNNYAWLSPDAKTSFIANGDIIEIKRIRHIEEMYGFKFADAYIQLIDYPDEPELEVKLLLNTIMSESPSLSSEDNRKLFEAVMEDYMDISQKRKRIDMTKKNPYFCALEVKFAYAYTCHKTQGGQWNTVFVEQGYLKPDAMDAEYMRWLYTAVTRATEQLYLVNFSDEFFSKQDWLVQ